MPHGRAKRLPPVGPDYSVAQTAHKQKSRPAPDAAGRVHHSLPGVEVTTLQTPNHRFLIVQTKSLLETC